MQIVARRTLLEFGKRHPRAERPLNNWYHAVRRAAWDSPSDVKALFGSTVDFVADNRIIFDIGGNKYRLIVHVSYEYKSVLLKFVGTHRDYDAIDPESV